MAVEIATNARRDELTVTVKAVGDVRRRLTDAQNFASACADCGAVTRINSLREEVRRLESELVAQLCRFED